MLSPLLIFVYNRPVHLKAALTAISANLLAKDTPLHVYADGARLEEDMSSVWAVRKLCHEIKGFASVDITESDINKGLADSIISGVSEQIAIYGKAIILEDDLVTTPLFLTYMNNALRHYEEDPAVFSIGGYSFPEHSFVFPPSYQWDVYATPRCCSWGWATWQDRWAKVNWNREYYTSFLNDAEAQKRFDLSGPDMTATLRSYYESKLDIWAVRFCYAHFINNMNCIYPVKSLVQNIGLDNSGMHCIEDPRRMHDKLDEAWLPQKFCPGNYMNRSILDRFYEMFT